MIALRADAELIESFWHYGGHSDELRKEGDFVLHKLAEHDVVLYHDGKEVIAFDNRCPHRGTRFFDTPSGNARAVCRYHGWSFSSGSLIVPMQAELMPGCPVPKINQYHTEWCGTFVFFAIAPMVALIDQLGAELHEILESVSFDCRALEDLNSYVYECPWQVAVENALEPQHLPFVHKETLNKLELINCRNRYWGANSGVYFDIGDAAKQKSLQRISHYYDLGQYVHPGYMSLFIFPFCFISSTAGTSYSVQNFFPRIDRQAWFTSRLYSVRLSKPRYQAADAELISLAIAINRRVFEEDHAICQRISRQAWERSLGNALYSNEEKIAAFREHLKAPA
jgi:phenylpropionate dioxygenase-like ring-hydroxylating dioxygenase large terminal subunit